MRRVISRAAARAGRVALLILLSLGGVSCGGSASGPTSPTPVSSPAPSAPEPARTSSGGTFDSAISATYLPCDSHRTFGDHQGKPCHRYGPFDLPVFGNLAIQLTGSQPLTNDLEFEVWRNGLPYTESGNEFGTSDSISGGAPAGSYEVRVVYLGSTSHSYRLRVAFTWN